MVEASLWVVGGLADRAERCDLLGRMPAGYAVTFVTVLGGALLGLGAYVNKACVFGAIARLGSGEWAYLVTPLGFYVGCVTSAHVFPFPAQQKLPYDSPVLHASAVGRAAVRRLHAVAPRASVVRRVGRSRRACRNDRCSESVAGSRTACGLPTPRRR